MIDTEILSWEATSGSFLLEIPVSTKFLKGESSVKRTRETEATEIIATMKSSSEAGGVVRQEIHAERQWLKIHRLFQTLVSDLEGFEAEFGMNSEDFYDAFQTGEIDEEREEYYEWRSKYSAYKHMHERFGLSR